MTMLDHGLDAAAFAVVDVETTGLVAEVDRVVEVCVVVMDPGRPLRVALDTLVNPGVRIRGTAIHGITDDDVAAAPRFEHVAAELVRALAGRVVVGHHVGFDLRLLAAEFGRLGLTLEVPFIDTMLLRPGLGDGPRATLSDACSAYGIPRTGRHVASADALDTANLFAALLARARTMGLRTFRELARAVDHPFVRSFARRPLDASAADQLPAATHKRSRLEDRIHLANNPARIYYDALMVALADLVVTEEEFVQLQTLRLQLGLRMEHVRNLHAQAYAGALMAMIVDHRVDADECARLRSLSAALRAAGWCPGDPADGDVARPARAAPNIHRGD